MKISTVGGETLCMLSLVSCIGDCVPTEGCVLPYPLLVRQFLYMHSLLRLPQHYGESGIKETLQTHRSEYRFKLRVLRVTSEGWVRSARKRLHWEARTTLWAANTLPCDAYNSTTQLKHLRMVHIPRYGYR